MRTLCFGVFFGAAKMALDLQCIVAGGALLERAAVRPSIQEEVIDEVFR